MTYLISGNKINCCGCSACVNVCNHEAIKMIADEEGFFYPSKNDKCINCGLCEKVCPYSQTREDVIKSFEDTENKTYPKVYAAYSEKDRKYSSSGGIFYVISKLILKDGGVVFGASFDSNLKLGHEAVEDLSEMERLRGSKYLQSEIGRTYRDIKYNLQLGKRVLFAGTPCQVAGLKSYLRNDNPLLMTIDVVCHGVPSQWLFDQHCKYLEHKYRAKLVSYQFRDNKKWGGCEIAGFKNPRKTIINPTYELSPYLYSFMYGFTFRYSCYECPFAVIPRQGDITLGDYWGVKNVFPNINSSSGVSVVLVNNNKGDEMWNLIKEEVSFYESSLEDASRENGNLIKHSSKPPIRDSIYNLIREKGYEEVAKKYFKSPNYSKIKFNLFKDKYFLKPLSFIYKLLFKSKK